MKNFIRFLDDLGDVIGTAILGTLITVARTLITPFEFLALLVTPKKCDRK